MRVQCRIVDDVAVFRIAGDHTPRDAGALRKSVSDVVRRGWRHIVIDLGQLKQLDGTGLGELIGVLGVVRRSGGRLMLSAVPGCIRYILAAANLEGVFDATDSESQAVAELTPAANRQVA